MPEVRDLGASGRDLADLPVCGFSARPSDPTVPLCNAPAVYHITPLQDGAKADWTIMACDTHAPYALGGSWDGHRISEACTAPGHMWVRATAFRVSGCAMPRQAARLAL